MKILLVGEYSGLHNSLKEGLIELGHQVTIISTGDYFKNYPADIKLNRKYESGLGKKLKVALYRLFGMDINSISLRRQFFRHQEHLKGFDIVQLINESPFGASPKLETEIITFLKKNNDKLFLLSCGADYMSVNYELGDALSYSILTGYKNKTVHSSVYDFALKYTRKPFIELHEYVYKNIRGVIASDIDYHMPLLNHPKYLGLIPNPVNIDKLDYSPLKIEGPISIFMGINTSNYHTKGIVYFEEALTTILEKYESKIEVHIAKNLPYSEYIIKYNNTHIVLDQVLGYDQGYNALEAMAKGKVVFTGAEAAFINHYNLTETVAINALPDSRKIADMLEDLILNPDKILIIGENARDFVKKEHDHIDIAKKYEACWNAH